MEEVEVSEEIENYILSKLDDAIQEAKSTEFSLLAKMFFRSTISEQFGELKKLLSPKGAPEDSNKRLEQLYYLNNTLTKWQMIHKKQKIYLADAITSVYNLRRSLTKIKQDFKKGDSSSRQPHDTNPSPPINANESSPPQRQEVSQYRWSTRFVDENKVHGLEDKVMSMERMLVLRPKREDPFPFKGIGIFGMAGIGKTTLSQMIFKRPQVQKNFLPRIWVCLSKRPKEEEDADNRKETVKRMLRSLGIDDKIINEVDIRLDLRGLVLALRLQLIGKRYLIVLDDAWNTDDWFKMMDSSEKIDEENEKGVDLFAYGLPKGWGGTVIVTSRRKEIAEKMVGEEENLHGLKPLSDKESCWLIFKDAVEEGGREFPQELESLKDEIRRRCDGLPLAAKMMGQIMHEQLWPSANGSTGEGSQQQTL